MRRRLRRLAEPARAPHCLLCVLSSGGGGRGGVQGTIPAPVALALWPPLRCPGRFGQGQRAAFLTFEGNRVPAPSEGRAWTVWGDRRWEVWVRQRARGSGQVLEDIGGRGRGRGFGGQAEGVDRFGGE